MAMTEDLGAFFSLSDFATTATWGAAGSARVIFEAPHAAPFGDAVDATQPACLAAAADVATLAAGGAISIDGADYTVAGLEPDGTGLVRIVLYPAA